MKTFEAWLKLWDLKVDGEPLSTQTSHLLPVRYKDNPCMLKIALVEEEQIGSQLMAWWNGQGAAKVFLQNENAILMERATGSRSLKEMARSHQDDEATAIICSVVAKLHSVSHKPLPEKMVPLSRWFKSLEMIAGKQEGLLKNAWFTAQYLLQKPQEITILHGDIHHQNILDFGRHGWLAIDPKGLLGERYFDYANIFCNPDEKTATKTGRLEKQARLISELAKLNYQRLLQWILAYAGLSAAWHLEEGSNAGLALEVAEITATLIWKEHLRI
jgi:streptomycin 6-kinase